MGTFNSCPNPECNDYNPLISIDPVALIDPEFLVTGATIADRVSNLTVRLTGRTPVNVYEVAMCRQCGYEAPLYEWGFPEETYAY